MLLVDDARIQAILNRIDAQYSRKTTLQEMAELAFMAEVSFCKFFKREFKKSFTHYLEECRVRKVREQLRETDHKLLEIAMNCGCENMSFFHHQFKKYAGIMPWAYGIKHKDCRC